VRGRRAWGDLRACRERESLLGPELAGGFHRRPERRRGAGVRRNVGAGKRCVGASGQIAQPVFGVRARNRTGARPGRLAAAPVLRTLHGVVAVESHAAGANAKRQHASDRELCAERPRPQQPATASRSRRAGGSRGAGLDNAPPSPRAARAPASEPEARIAAAVRHASSPGGSAAARPRSDTT
jgi:hypothetical protein